MTTWTNKHQIDPAIAAAIMNDDYEGGGDISATGLLKPPQMSQLLQKHEAEIVEDVGDHLRIFIGRAVHDYILKQSGSAPGRRQEERLTWELDGWEISGQFDVYYGDTATLKDYKTTSKWAYIYGRNDWEAQLNIYAYLARKNGLQVDHLQVVGLLLDWVKLDQYQAGMPPISYGELSYNVWPMDYTERFIRVKITEHKTARAGESVRACLPEERWAQPEKWAVQKHKAKRAFRVEASRFKAQQWLDKMTPVKAGEYTIKHRPGKQVRCEDYCPVVKWCEQAKQLGVGQDAEASPAYEDLPSGRGLRGR